MSQNQGVGRPLTAGLERLRAESVSSLPYTHLQFCRPSAVPHTDAGWNRLAALPTRTGGADRGACSAHGTA